MGLLPGWSDCSASLLLVLLVASHKLTTDLNSKSGVVSALQLINHGVPDDVIQGMKANIEAFFGLPAETKQQFAQERGQLEGYGQLFVVSEDQKLDWADILYLNTQPPEHRNRRFWPDKPDTLRYSSIYYCYYVYMYMCVHTTYI